MWHTPSTLEEAMLLADTLSQSSLISDDLRNPHNMLLLMGVAASLDISIFVGIRTINVIKGKAILGADGMAAVVRRSELVEQLDVVESDEKRCVVRAQRVGGEPFEIVWDWDMAVKAGLTVNKRFNKDTRRYETVPAENYQKYPRQMLRARALSEACRLGWPDVVGGVYDPDELSQSPQSGELKAITAEHKAIDVTAELTLEPEPKVETKAEPKPEPKVETKAEPKPESKAEDTAQAFKELAADFIRALKERGIEDAHEKLLNGYVQSVSQDKRYNGKKAGDVKDFDLLTEVYDRLWSQSPQSAGLEALIDKMRTSGDDIREDDPYREQDIGSYPPI
jgi:hypothetical protein